MNAGADIGPEESQTTGGKGSPGERVRSGAETADDDVIVLTDAIGSGGVNGAGRGRPENEDDAPVCSTDATASSQELERAIERVVDRLFTQKIEGMIADIIERALTREIARLKRALLDDESYGDGTTGP